MIVFLSENQKKCLKKKLQKKMGEVYRFFFIKLLVTLDMEN